MHCLEEEMDHEVFQEFDVTPMEYWNSIGLLPKNTTLIHACWVEGDDNSRLMGKGTLIAHCPMPNMKPASGFCPVSKLLKERANVEIG